jgi:hypothetical protein
MIQVLEHLPSKCKALSSTPGTTKKNLKVSHHGEDVVPLTLATYLPVPQIFLPNTMQNNKRRKKSTHNHIICLSQR